jgi:photosystem II stability/assembly factor-like uncharacterized protein
MAPDWAAGGSIIAATDDGLLVSTDGGVTWATASGPDYPYVLATTSSGLLVGAYDEGVYYSAQGDAWHDSNDQMAAHLPPMAVFSDRFAQDRSLIMASMEGTIVRSMDGATTWEVVPSGGQEGPGEVWGTVSLLAGAGEGTSMALLAAAEAELAYSEDAGTSWSMLTGIVQEPISALAFSSSFKKDRTMLVGTAGGQVLVSRDAGASWQERVAFEGEMVVALALLGEVLYVVTARQTETGTWQLALQSSTAWQVLFTCEANQPAALFDLSAAPYVYCAMEQHVVCVSSAGQVVESELEGVEQISSLAAAADTVLAGSRKGLYASQDGAQSWECVSSDIPIVALHSASPDKAYAVSMGGGLWEISMEDAG